MDLTQPELTLAEIYEITTQEGAVARFTSHDTDILTDKFADFFTNAIDISLTTTVLEWLDIDVSAYVPSGASVVVIRVYNTSGSSEGFGLRKKGSTDNITGSLFGTTTQTTMYIGVDADRVLQGYITVANVIKFELLGYFSDNEAVAFTNSYDKSLSVADAWTDIDCSAEIPAGATFALFDVVAGFNTDEVGFRNNGSSDDRKINANCRHVGIAIGIDSGRICEAYAGSGTLDKFYLVGYIKNYYGVPKVNGLNKSLVSTGEYVNVDLSADAPENAIAAIVEVFGTVGNPTDFALRKDGSTDDFYYRSRGHNGTFLVGLNSDIFEGKISAIDCDFYILGYIVSSPPGTSYQAIPIKRSEINYHTDLQVDKVDISLGLVGILIGEKEYSIPKIIRLGLFRNAHVKISLIDYVALDETKLLFEGWITQGITYNKGICTITVGSLLDKLNEKFPKYIYSEYCNHQLFSAYCGLIKDDYKENSAIAGGSTQTIIYSGIFAFSAHAEGYWAKGEIKMTAGDNIDISRSIFKHGDGYVELLIPFPETIVVGETFEVWPGCDKSGQTCDEKWPISNYENFLGFENIPQPEILYSY